PQRLHHRREIVETTMLDFIVNPGFLWFGLLFIAMLTTVSLMGIRNAHRNFRATLLSFFGKRGPYDNFKQFLDEYKSQIVEDTKVDQRRIVRVWRTFLDDIKVAENRE